MSLLNNLRVLKDVRIGGNLDVAGETTYSVTSISTENLNIKDRHIFLNKDHTESDGLADGGYVVNTKAYKTQTIYDSDANGDYSFNGQIAYVDILADTVTDETAVVAAANELEKSHTNTGATTDATSDFDSNNEEVDISATTTLDGYITDGDYTGWQLTISASGPTGVYSVTGHTGGVLTISPVIASNLDANSVITLSAGTVGSSTVYISGATGVQEGTSAYVGWSLVMTDGTAGPYAEGVDHITYPITAHDTKSITLASPLRESFDATSAFKLTRFAISDFVQISGSREHVNDGVFSVEAWNSTTTPAELTVKAQTTPTHPAVPSVTDISDLADFVQYELKDDDQLQAQPEGETPALSGNARVTHIRLSLFRHDASGSIIHSWGDDEPELITNQTTLATEKPNTCIVVGFDNFAAELPYGHPPLDLSVSGTTTLDLSVVEAKNLAETYIVEVNDTGNGDTDDMKIVMPDTADVPENTKIRIVIKKTGPTSNTLTIHPTTGSGDQFDDGETPQDQIDLLENADKVDLSSSSCDSIVSTWYMG